MIGLQWRPGKPERKPQPAPVVISSGPATPAIERESPPYDPFAAFHAAPLPAITAFGGPAPKKRGRPRKVK